MYIACNMFSAFLFLQITVPFEWLDRFAAATEPQLHLFDGRQLATLAWALLRQSHRSGDSGRYLPPPSWTSSFLLATGPQLSTMTDQQLGYTLWHVNG